MFIVFLPDGSVYGIFDHEGFAEYVRREVNGKIQKYNRQFWSYNGRVIKSWF